MRLPIIRTETVYTGAYGEVAVADMPTETQHKLLAAPLRKDGFRLDMRYRLSREAHREAEAFIKAQWEAGL